MLELIEVDFGNLIWYLS